MTFFVGTKGNVRLRRGVDISLGTISASVETDDIQTSLNRVGIEGAVDNLFSGDRVDITTDDARGLDFIPASNWSTGLTEDTFSAYINVNAAGGLRLFNTFADAINNTRANEIALEAFTGDSIAVKVGVRDVAFNVLGNVTNYEFQSNREAIDITTLSDKFRKQYSAGVISGSGRIDCAFNYITSGVEETPQLILQLIQRLDLGSAFDLALYLTDKEVDPDVENIFYLLTAVVTSSGVRVAANEIITCSLDFVTTGDVRLVVGKPSQYILKEDDDRIRVEHSLNYLLQEDTD
tara:strand:+ start:4419 stop:5294 length:876 start_codon:yes stop_codon:yes gene_type:complete